MAKQKKLTEAEWVRRANAMGREIEDYSASIHPSCWATDLHLLDMKKRYLKLAKSHPEPVEGAETSG